MTTPTPAFLARFAEDVTLAPGVARTIDVPIHGARSWRFLLANTGDEDVTAATLSYSPLGNLHSEPEAFGAGIPLAPGATTPIVGSDAPVTSLRLTLTSTAGTTVRLEGGGW